MAEKQTSNPAVALQVAVPDGRPVINFVRNERVMLDSDLAAVYRVETKAMNRAIGRNASRLPRPFRVSASIRGVGIFEVQNRHLKRGARRQTVFTLGIYGT